MAKLYFRHGAVDSAKTLNLLAVAHNYRKQGKKILIVKPAIDDRFGLEKVVSRAGLEKDADLLIRPGDSFPENVLEGTHCILVDEAQFLEEKVIEQLRQVAILGIPVICYGLRTDFQTRLFPGSKRIMELADSIEEIKVTCVFCNRKAVFNLRSIDGEPVSIGPQVLLGAENVYSPVCAAHYYEKLSEGCPTGDG